MPWYIPPIMRPVSGILNPIREIGALAHKYHAVFTVDTTSTYAMRPIHIEEDNIDFCMASAQKGLMAMTGLSFVVGSRAVLGGIEGLSQEILLLQSVSAV